MTATQLGVATTMLFLVACGEAKKCLDASDCPLQAQGADAGSLSECVAGAWRAYGDGGSCRPIPCRADGGGPLECGQVDCVQQVFTVFVPASSGSAGIMFGGSYVASPSASTWSSTVVADRYEYSVDGSKLMTDNGTGPRSQEVTCTAEQLVLGQFALKIRASAVESAALRRLMIDGGTWSNLPYP